MNKKQARQWAQQNYGPTASAVNVSSRNRDERFGIVYIDLGGPMQPRALFCLGKGDSFQKAVQDAKNNPVAQGFQRQWSVTKKEFEEFGKDPHSYMQKRKKQMQEIERQANEDLASL